MQKVFFHTLGCRLNQAETAVLQSVLRDNGFRVVDDLAAADIVVINSCTVTAHGDNDAKRFVGRVQRQNPNARIAIIGCQAQIQKDTLLEWPQVHWVIGTARKMRLVEILRGDHETSGGVFVPAISRTAFEMPLTRTAGNRMRANLKVQDGCDNFCAYCEIPYARGRARSRIFENVLEEAHALVAAGHKEIVLTGINLGLYAHEGRSLLDIVRALHKVPGLERIRISSIEHTSLPLKLSQWMFPNGILCRFLHIPLQSGSDRILQKMGRKYTAAEYASMAHALAVKNPGIMIGTDVIVGFPGETEKDFHQTLQLLKDLPLGYFHVFSYSPRRRARSRDFKGEVPAEVVRKRSEQLRDLSANKRKAFLGKHLGLVERVLFEQKKNDHWIGHTDNYVKIKVFSEMDLRNKILDVRTLRLDDQVVVGGLENEGKK